MGSSHSLDGGIQIVKTKFRDHAGNFTGHTAERVRFVDHYQPVGFGYAAENRTLIDEDIRTKALWIIEEELGLPHRFDPPAPADPGSVSPR